MGNDKLKYTERCFRTAGNWNASKRGGKKMERMVGIFGTGALLFHTTIANFLLLLPSNWHNFHLNRMELRWRKIKIRRTSREPSVPFDIFEKPRTMEKYNTHEIIFPTLFLYKFTLRSSFYSKSFAIHYDFSIMFIGCDIGACYVLIQNIARFRINKKTDVTRVVEKRKKND